MSRAELDEYARELDRLRRFLTRPGPRFGLALGLYADARAARSVRTELDGLVGAAGKQIASLELDHDDASADLVARMVDAGAGADALHVVGLDSLVVDGLGQLRKASALANLNQRRDELPTALDLRVVFWIAHEHYPQLTEVAWDLVQVMLTTAEFHAVEAVALSADAFADEDADDDAEYAAPSEDEREALEAQLGNLDRVLDQARKRRETGPRPKAAGAGPSQVKPIVAPAAPAPGAAMGRSPAPARRPAPVSLPPPAAAPSASPGSSAAPSAPKAKVAALDDFLATPSAAEQHQEQEVAEDQGELSYEDGASLADAAASAGEVAARLGDVERGRALLTEAAEAWVEAGDALEAARSLRRVAELHLEQGEYDAVCDTVDRGALVLQTKLADLDSDAVEREYAALHLLRAEAKIGAGEYEQAEDELRQARERFEALADDRGRARAYAKLATIREHQGELDAALELRRDLELPAYLAAEDLEAAAQSRTRIAELLAQVGETGPAIDMIREQVLPAARTFTNQRPAQQALSALAVVLEARGELAAAAQVRRDELGEPEPSASSSASMVREPDEEGSSSERIEFRVDETVDLRWWILIGLAVLMVLVVAAVVVP